MVPPVVVTPVFVYPDGAVMVKPTPELRVMLVALDAEIAELLPRNVNCGVLIVSEVPLVIVSVFPEAIVIDPPVACE